MNYKTKTQKKEKREEKKEKNCYGQKRRKFAHCLAVFLGEIE